MTRIVWIGRRRFEVAREGCATYSGEFCRYAGHALTAYELRPNGTYRWQGTQCIDANAIDREEVNP
jgi:hypothetical protein